MKLRTLLPIVVIVSAAAFTAQPAAAQVLAPDMLRSPVIKETEIRPFAAAVKNVQRVTDFYSPLAAATRTPEELDKVESAAFHEMKEAVTKEGFTISRFNQIVAMARLDPDLADRIGAHLR